MNVKIFIQTLAKYGMTVSEEQAKDYEAFFTGQTLPEDKTSAIKSDLAGLVEKVMQEDPEFAKRIKEITNKQPEQPLSSLPELNIEHLGYRGSHDFFKELDDKHLVLASIGDIYKYASILKKWTDEGNYVKILETQTAIKSFQENFPQQARIFTSTRVFYRPNKGRADIVDYFRVKSREQSVRSTPLPKYHEPNKLAPKEYIKENTLFLQALLNTNDSHETMLDTIDLLLRHDDYWGVHTYFPLLGKDVLQSDISLIHCDTGEPLKHVFCIDCSQKDTFDSIYVLRKNK